MKKSLSALLSLVLTLGMGSVALAATPTPSIPKTIPFNKVYVLENDGTLNPAETFNYTVIADGISGATMPSTAVLPSVTISSGAVFEKGDAKLATDLSLSKTKQMTLSLPEYRHVGVYTYKINEVNGMVSGVTYDQTNLYLRVQVTEETGGILVPHPVFYYGTYHEYDRTVGTKVDKITNKYSAGNLAVTKKVSGNFGERDKYFSVTVTFTVPAGLHMNSDVTFEGGKYVETPVVAAVSATSPGRTFTQTFEVKDDDTVTFKNIPYGVTYTVVEANYSAAIDGGYATTYSTFDGNINSLMDTVEIRNDKNLGVDTGISLDSIPYVLLLGFSVIGMAVLAFKKRKQAKF